MDHRGFLSRWTIICVLICGSSCLAAKLSPDQKAPPFARGSGGLILNTPFESEQPKGAPTVVDGVEREETVMLKEVDGQLVRTVKGHFAYKSPEGLPIFVKYEADENGNRASFRFGTAASGGLTSRPSQGTGGAGGGGGGGGRPPSGQGSTYLPPTEPKKNVDRMYLPPS